MWSWTISYDNLHIYIHYDMNVGGLTWSIYPRIVTCPRNSLTKKLTSLSFSSWDLPRPISQTQNSEQQGRIQALLRSLVRILSSLVKHDIFTGIVLVSFAKRRGIQHTYYRMHIYIYYIYIYTHTWSCNHVRKNHISLIWYIIMPWCLASKDRLSLFIWWNLGELTISQCLSMPHSVRRLLGSKYAEGNALWQELTW